MIITLNNEKFMGFLEFSEEILDVGSFMGVVVNFDILNETMINMQYTLSTYMFVKNYHLLDPQHTSKI